MEVFILGYPVPWAWYIPSLHPGPSFALCALSFGEEGAVVIATTHQYGYQATEIGKVRGKGSRDDDDHGAHFP